MSRALARPLTLLLVVAGALCTVSARALDEVPTQRPWCAPELEALTDTVCAYEPGTEAAEGSPRGPRTLVIFLHGLVKRDSDWAWGQQRLMARMAKTHVVSALM